MEEIDQDPTTHERSRIVELVRKFGGFTTDAVLDPAMKIFTQNEINGFIGYRMTDDNAVIFGEPICAKEDKAALTKAFHAFAKNQNKGVIYIAASQDFARWAMQDTCCAMIEFGEELTFTPPTDPRKMTGNHASLVRRKVKQALHDGVVVQEYIPHDSELEKAIDHLGEIWLKSRTGPQVHISNIHLFEDRVGKRWIYAKQNDKVVGVIQLNQLQAHQGWLLNHLMAAPDAPHGTSELLVASALEILENEGCRFVTVGAVAGSKLGEIVGLNTFFTWMARSLFKIAKKIVRFDRLNVFWGKFNTQSRPAYLLFSRNRIGIKELKSIKQALNGKNP